MAQTSRLEIQQRDRDLIPEADHFLTDDKLDGLWEWFCAASHDRFHPQMIFAKLMNAARKPYRENLVFARGQALITPSSTHYAPSEYTVTAGHVGEEGQEQPKPCEDIEVLRTKLAIAEDSLQMKQMLLLQLEGRIKTMNQEMEDNRERLEGEKRQLELDLKNRDQEHQAYKRETEDKRRQWEQHLASIRPEYEEDKPTQISLESAFHPETFIAVAGEEVTADSRSSPNTIFTLLKHQDGTVSFQTSGHPIAYLSADCSCIVISNTCGSREKFSLHNWSSPGKVAIESRHFARRFLYLAPAGTPKLRLQSQETLSCFYVIPR
ncbi:hypothetical protein BDZ91DRAFT_742885 [Kalaharituber pfeilii]|nr:hypothetical protein BDZ91DRAFT_742885 [Kalaharituber pfeilii]